MDWESHIGKDKGSFTVNLNSPTTSVKSTNKNTVNTKPKKELFIHHIDVGQGEATLINATCDGNTEFTVLIDGGRYTRGGGTVARYLRRLNITTIHLMICTHHDADHIEGLVRILHEEKFSTKKKKISVVKIIDRKANEIFTEPSTSSHIFSAPKEEDFAEGNRFCFYEEPPETETSAPQTKTNISLPKSTEDEDTSNSIEWFKSLAGKRGVAPESNSVIAYSDAKDPQFKLTCLHVNTVGDVTTEENNYSIALLLEYGNFRYFTGGDLESEHEDKLIAKLKGDSHLCAFKCGHHGSKHSTSVNFLKDTDARRAFISCGHHSYYHPDTDLINRLCAHKPLKQFFLTNCYYNRQGVNPDYLDQEITLLAALAAKIVEAAIDAVNACTGLTNHIADTHTVYLSINTPVNTLKLNADDLKEGADQITGANDLNLPNVKVYVTSLATNTAELKKLVAANTDFSKLKQSAAPKHFEAQKEWDAAFDLVQAKVRRFADCAKAAADMMTRFDLGVKALEAVDGDKAKLVKGAVAGGPGHLGNIVLHITALEAQVEDHEYHIGYWNGSWTWFPQRCAEGPTRLLDIPKWDFGPACEIKTLKMDPPWTPMFQWDSVIEEDNALDFALVTGASGSHEKREPKTEEYISPEEVIKEDLFHEEEAQHKHKFSQSKDSRAKKSKQTCVACNLGDSSLLERTCPSDGCTTVYFVHRTCNSRDVNCGAH